MLYADYASVYRLLHVYSSSYSMWYMLQKHSGSTGTKENQSGKPPLPNNALAELRKGSYYASLELVQSLCDTSYGLVDIFPVEDLKTSVISIQHDSTQHLFMKSNTLSCSYMVLHFMAFSHMLSHVLLYGSLLWISIPTLLLLRKTEVIFAILSGYGAYYYLSTFHVFLWVPFSA
jgi:hypothetical protein